MDKEKKCAECDYFIGGGDWNLCCSNPSKNEVPPGYLGGFLCYEDTPVCDEFKRKENK